MRQIATLAVACALLSGCANTAPVDLCKGAEARRAVYTSTVVVADAYIASGRPVPPAVTAGRAAAQTALVMLDAHCPRPAD